MQSSVYLIVAAHNSHRPSGTTLYRSKEHIFLIAFVTHHGLYAALSVHHHTTDLVCRSVIYFGSGFINIAVQHQRLHWTSQNLSFARYHEVVARRIYRIGIDEIAEPFERHIGSHHSHHTSLAIVNRHNIGTEHHPCSSIIIVRFRPRSRVSDQSCQIPRSFKVVVRGRAYLFHFNTTIFILKNIRFEPTSLFRIIVTNKANTATNNR